MISQRVNVVYGNSFQYWVIFLPPYEAHHPSSIPSEAPVRSQRQLSSFAYRVRRSAPPVASRNRKPGTKIFFSRSNSSILFRRNWIAIREREQLVLIFYNDFLNPCRITVHTVRTRRGILPALYTHSISLSLCCCNLDDDATKERCDMGTSWYFCWWWKKSSTVVVGVGPCTTVPAWKLPP